MVAGNLNNRFSSGGSEVVFIVNRPTGRVPHYIDRQTECATELFLLALKRLIDAGEQRDTEWSSARPRVSAEEIRLHGRLTARIQVLNYERYGLWPRLRRFLFDNRLVRAIAARVSQLRNALVRKE